MSEATVQPSEQEHPDVSSNVAQNPAPTESMHTAEEEGFEESGGEYISGTEDDGLDLDSADVMELQRQKLALLEKRRQLVELLKAQGGELPPELAEELQINDQEFLDPANERKKRVRPDDTMQAEYTPYMNVVYNSKTKRGRPPKKRQKLGDDDDDGDDVYYDESTDTYSTRRAQAGRGRPDDGKRARTTWSLEENRILLRMLEQGITDTQTIYDALRTADPHTRKTVEHVKNKRANLSQKAAQRNTTVIEILREDIQRLEVMESYHGGYQHPDAMPVMSSAPGGSIINGSSVPLVGQAPEALPQAGMYGGGAPSASMSSSLLSRRRGPGRPRKADFTPSVQPSRTRFEPGVVVTNADVATLLNELKQLQETDRQLIITQSRLMKHHGVEEEDLQFPEDFDDMDGLDQPSEPVVPTEKSHL